jgi:hypothetical protein
MRLLAAYMAPLPPAPRPADETLVLVNVPTIMAAPAWVYPIDKRDAPARVRVLLATQAAVTVTREDARTLLVAMAPGGRIDPAAALFADDAHAPHEGERYAVPGLEVEVVRAAGPYASVLRYRFARALEDPRYRWIAWNKAFEESRPPAIGQQITVGAE